MSQQQLLLYILGTIIVRVGIYMGILMFASSNISTNREAIVSDLQELGADANSYVIRPRMMAGGGGAFGAYAISDIGPWGSSNANASYAITSQSATQIEFTATSKVVTGGIVTMAYDSFGKVVSGPTATGF